MGLRDTLAKAAIKAIGTDVFGTLLAMNGMSSTPRLGTRQLLQAYNTMPWLRAVVQKVGWSVATNRWQLFVAQRGSKAIRDDIISKATNTWQRKALIARALQTGDLREVTQNAFLDFIAAGTPPFFDGLIAGQLSQSYLDMVGESLWVYERRSIGGANGRGVPMSYWVIPPSWIQGVPSIGSPFFHIVGPYGTKYVDAADTLWLYQPNPADPYRRGTGIGHTLGDELETDEYAAKYTKAFFHNDARPPFLMTVKGASPEELKRTETWWQTKHQGFGRWWKPGFMNKEVDIHEFGESMKDMGMKDLRLFERDIVLQVYGFPPEIFGITESSNRATSEAAKSIYAEHVVEPRLEFKRAGLQRVAETEFDERLIVEFVSPVPEDKEFQLKVVQALPYNFQADEIRHMAGQPELADGSGKVHMVPFTVVPRKRLDEGDDFSSTLDDQEELAFRARRKFHSRMKITDADIAKLVTAVKPESVARKAKPVVQDAIKFFGQQAIDEVGGNIDFNLRDPRVESFLNRWAGERIKRMVNDTTQEALRGTLAEAVANGESTGDIVNRIKDVFDEASTSRAELISRTELGRASNFSALEGMEQVGIEEKEWLATQDGETRDTHADLDGTRVGIHDNFVSASGAQAQHPGDFGDAAEDCNCRCGVLSVIPESGSQPGRMARWKALEADRAPFIRRLRRAMRQGFAEQELAVLEALDDATKAPRRTVA